MVEYRSIRSTFSCRT